MKILIDIGSNKNYIQPRLVKNPIPNEEIFNANSVAGDIKITHHTKATLFNIPELPIKFFILPTLKSFHAILGNDTLKELGAIINTEHDNITLSNKMRIKLKQYKAQSVHNITIRNEHMSEKQKKVLQFLTDRYKRLFSEPDEKLTYTTRVVGEIRTKEDTPVYSNYITYPMSMKEEVEKQVGKLLEDGIIRPSRSPYCSPVWVVAKKPDASGEKKFRMVIDFRKLNKITIPDRYPLPDINYVLMQLKGNRYFSVLDLKSGFHQIPLKESDIEKTAFAINNGKYEFVRLPFGLKNAPAIFQRTLDDILREHLGKICFVYIDDIIIFSQDEMSHAKNLETIFKTLNDANMKIQLDKCEFYKDQVEFLGFVVTTEGIRSNPKKVDAIANFPIPKTLKSLRSFLGMSGYYRRFVKDYAKIAKPMTKLLRGEDGRLPKNISAKKEVKLDQEALDAFRKIINTLVSEDLLLVYPDFSKEFHLTTDASNYALGAVLEQEGRPIAFISRTLQKREEHLATNEREMLAIVWALDAFKKYLYGTAKVKIFTDHQPLTFAIGNKNSNWKLKRWKERLEEYDYELFYKPGKSNIVADALSRAPADQNPQINSMTGTVHSDESSGEELVPAVEAPINGFKNQLLISEGDEDSYKFEIPFPTYHRHTIVKPNCTEEILIDLLKKHLNPSVTNGLFTSESIMGRIQNFYAAHFTNYRIRFTQTRVRDVTSETEQEEVIISEHKRAHRNAKENKSQLLEKVYFPKMSPKINKIVKQCNICKLNKYERHPPNPEVKETPIPQFPGQILHVDIYLVEKRYVLTALDKFSKYAQVKLVNSRAAEDLKEPLRQLLFTFGVPEMIILDNEKALNSQTINFMLDDQLGIKVYKTPPHHSTSNGQVERFHSTLTEIMRCLKSENVHNSFHELLDRAVYEYNYSIHSTTERRPLEVFFGRRVSVDPSMFEKSRQDNIEKLKQKQQKDLEVHNKNRTPYKSFNIGDTIYVKINKRYGTKLSPKYKSEVVKENKNSTVITNSGRTIHKSQIRN